MQTITATHNYDIPDTNVLNDQPCSVGSILKNRRESLQLSLADVSQRLRIRQDYLENIEEENIQRLPELPYTLGFVRSYADLLNMDANKIVEQFKNNMPPAECDHKLEYVNVRLEQRLPEPRWIIASIGAVIIFWGLWFLWPTKPSVILQEESLQDGLALDQIRDVVAAQHLSQNFNVATREKHSEELIVGELIPTASTLYNFFLPYFLQGSPSESTQIWAFMQKNIHPFDYAGTIFLPSHNVSTLSSQGITFRAKEPVWIELKDHNDQVVYNGILRTGQTYETPINSQPLKLTAGNAGGLEGYIGNESIGFFGKKGEVKKNVMLTPESFIKSPPVNP